MKTLTDVIKFVEKEYPEEKNVYELILDALASYKEKYQEYKQFDVELEQYFKNGRVKLD